MEQNQQVNAPVNKSFYQCLNDLISPDKGNYFGSIDNCLGLSGDYENMIMDNFKKKLIRSNSIRVYYAICDGVINNNPVIYVADKTKYTHIFEYLINEGFHILSDQNGFYIELGSPLVSYDGYISVSQIFKRAITTRFMVMSIMYQIYTNLTDLVILQYDTFIEYKPPTNYINLVVIEKLLIKLLPLKIVNTGKKIRIELNDTKTFPEHFKVVRTFENIMDDFYSKIELEATARKKSTILHCITPQLRELLYNSLVNDGFRCIRNGNTVLEIDWANGGKEMSHTFAYKCWIRTNTVWYYRNCASFITISIRKDPNVKDLVLPDTTRPIDEKFFMDFFNQRQMYRCDPIEKSDWGCFIVSIKPVEERTAKP